METAGFEPATGPVQAGCSANLSFIPESFCDSLAYAQAVALATTRLAVGTAITNVYLRQPTLLAEEAAAVQAFSGGRLRLGIGVGHRAVNEPLGIQMDDPLGKIRSNCEALTFKAVASPPRSRPAWSSSRASWPTA